MVFSQTELFIILTNRAFMLSCRSNVRAWMAAGHVGHSQGAIPTKGPTQHPTLKPLVPLAVIVLSATTWSRCGVASGKLVPACVTVAGANTACLEPMTLALQYWHSAFTYTRICWNSLSFSLLPLKAQLPCTNL